MHGFPASANASTNLAVHDICNLTNRNPNSPTRGIAICLLLLLESNLVGCPLYTMHAGAQAAAEEASANMAQAMQEGEATPPSEADGTGEKRPREEPVGILSRFLASWTLNS